MLLLQPDYKEHQMDKLFSYHVSVKLPAKLSLISDIHKGYSTAPLSF